MGDLRREGWVLDLSAGTGQVAIAFAAIRYKAVALDADEAWVQIREKARPLFEDAAVDNPFHPAARSEAEIDDFLASIRLDRRNELRIGSSPRITLRDFIEKIVSGELCYIWNVPKHFRESCLPTCLQTTFSRLLKQEDECRTEAIRY